MLGASNYTYADATETRRSAVFIQSHSRTVEYLAGVPALIVPGQLKRRRTRRVSLRADSPTGVRGLGRALSDRHFARPPGEPRDKAKAEVAVQIAQRWIRRLVPARDTVRHKNRPNLRVTEVRSSSNGYRSPAASRARPQMCAAQLADETSDRSMASFSCPPRPHLVSHSRNVPNACEGHSAIQGRRQDAAKKEKTRGRVREGTTTISPRGLAARVLCARQ